MGRPLGSKNKTKLEEEVVPVVEKWNPAPDMGKIQPPPLGESVCSCSHKQEMHYGGPKGWCNTRNCNCQEFKGK